MNKKIFLAISMLFFSNITWSYNCIGKIDNLNQNRNGSISLISQSIYGNNSGRKICSLTETWKGVEPAVCNAWLSKLLASKASGSSVVMQYDEGDSCSSLPAWSAASSPMAIWEAN